MGMGEKGDTVLCWCVIARSCQGKVQIIRTHLVCVMSWIWCMHLWWIAQSCNYLVPVSRDTWEKMSHRKTCMVSRKFQLTAFVKDCRHVPDYAKLHIYYHIPIQSNSEKHVTAPNLSFIIISSCKLARKIITGMWLLIHYHVSIQINSHQIKYEYNICIYW